MLAVPALLFPRSGGISDNLSHPVHLAAWLRQYTLHEAALEEDHIEASIGPELVSTVTVWILLIKQYNLLRPQECIFPVAVPALWNKVLPKIWMVFTLLVFQSCEDLACLPGLLQG